jgi:hypothetical protein
LASAEFVRKEAAHVRSETDQLEKLFDSPMYFFLRDALVGLDRFADDLSDTHARAKGAVGVLKHHLDLAPVVHQVLAGETHYIAAFELDGARRWLFGGEDKFGGGGLSAAGLPH